MEHLSPVDRADRIRVIEMGLGDFAGKLSKDRARDALSDIEFEMEVLVRMLDKAVANNQTKV